MRDERRDGAEIEKRAIYTENDSDSEALGWFVLISILGFNGIGNELYGRNSRSRSCRHHAWRIEVRNIYVLPAAKSKSKTRTTRTGKQNKRRNGMVLNDGGETHDCLSGERVGKGWRSHVMPSIHQLRINTFIHP